ncbi:MAG: penicillin-binding protein [Oscillospiraceae bacterium]|nr:penicillin-binding protein [Oscillospiraceae bacterium]
MTKIKRRSAVLLILILLLAMGMGIFLVRYFRNGRQWAAFSANRTAYTDGVLKHAQITDRNGEVLLTMEDGAYRYSSDALTRISTLHATGDRYGNIGTGANVVFREYLTGYDVVNGLYRSDRSGSVALSIDAELNRRAWQALNGRKGTVAVCDCDTGEILCMVSAPSFDPESPPDSVDVPEYEGVYINRFLSSAYTPGSIFKLVTAAAALEQLPGAGDRTYPCDGSWEIGNDAVTCMGVHGELSLRQALAVSCNCYFAQLAVDLGGETMEKQAAAMGLTEPVFIDGIPSARGRYVASAETLDTAWSGVGQGQDSVCPASMLRLMTAIANGGRAVELTLLRGGSGAEGGRLLPEKTAEILAELMHNDVVASYGEDLFPGVTAYAKSGTAEVGGGVAPHAWFVGFGRKDGRTLAFAVLVENGGYGSSAAGSVASDVMKAAFGG